MREADRYECLLKREVERLRIEIMEHGIEDPRISVIIMAFNEAHTLEMVVREIDSTLSEAKQPYEVVIVNDGSQDETGEIAERLAEELECVRVIHHETNKGLGGVYRTGFAHAQGGFITFFPADGQLPAAILKQFTPLMGEADMVLSYLPKRSDSVLAKSLSWAERALYRLLFGPLPKVQGTIMFRRTLLDEVELKTIGSRGWAVVIELIIRASKGGYKLVSVPTEMRPRMSGRSKVKNLPTIWANLKQAIALYRYL